MAGGFDVVIEGPTGPAVLCRLRETFGAGHVAEDARSVRVTLSDQAAMIGALRQLHDLGAQIVRVTRRGCERSPASLDTR